jgi:hypothetical protein
MQTAKAPLNIGNICCNTTNYMYHQCTALPTCSSPILLRSQIMTRLSAPQLDRIVSCLGLQPTCSNEHEMQQQQQQTDQKRMSIMTNTHTTASQDCTATASWTLLKTHAHMLF